MLKLLVLLQYSNSSRGNYDAVNKFCASIEG